MTDIEGLIRDAGGERKPQCSRCGEAWKDNAHRCQDELVARLLVLLTRWHDTYAGSTMRGGKLVDAELDAQTAEVVARVRHNRSTQ